MTTTGPVTVQTTWTLLLDLTGKLIQTMTVSRESEQTMYLIYTGPNQTPAADATPEWTVTKSFLGIETGRIPTGGRVFARMATEAASVEVNYD